MTDISKLLSGSSFDIGGDPISEKIRPTSLKDFLKFLAVVEEKVNEIEVPHQKVFYAFKELITDLNRCAISGSAVYEYRLGKEPQASDIDFFIDGSGKNKEIVLEFFRYEMYKKIFGHFANHYLEDEKFFYSNGQYKNTTFEGYAFIKHNMRIETGRFSFNPKEFGGFNLNFIFVEPLTYKELRLLNLDWNEEGSLYNHRLYFPEASGQPECFKIAFISKNDQLLESDIYLETKMLLGIYPRGIPIHHIHESFDFEELKYVFSFDVQQPVSTYIAGKILLERFYNELKNQPDGEIKRQLYNRSQREIARLEYRNKEFILNTGDPNTLNIALGTFTWNDYRAIKGKNLAQIDRNISLEDLFMDMHPKLMVNLSSITQQFLNNILPRIKKYSSRGITIRDPNLILSNVKYFSMLYSLYIMGDSSINQIVSKELLMSGKQLETQKLKKLREVTKAFNKILKNSEIKYSISEEDKGAATYKIEPEF